MIDINEYKTHLRKADEASAECGARRQLYQPLAMTVILDKVTCRSCLKRVAAGKAPTTLVSGDGALAKLSLAQSGRGES